MPSRPPDLSPPNSATPWSTTALPISAASSTVFPRLGLIAPVTQGRRTLRRQTLQRLIERRASAQAEKRAEDARRTLIEATAGAIAPQALPPCRADLADAAAIAQLADDFVIGTTTSEGLTFGALLLKGWRPDQIKAYADAARAVADRKQIAEVGA